MSDVQLHLGDCLEFMRGMDAGSVDAMITDPPYGIGADKKNAHSSIRDNESWENKDWDKRQPERVRQAISLCQISFVWGGNYYTDVLPVSSFWVAWVKPEAETGFSLADMELCWSNLDKAARVKRFSRRDGNEHPTQKPVALMRWIIENYTQPTDTIFDPFMGSGTTGVAAVQLGRSFIGCEIDPQYFAIAEKRISQAKQQPALFQLDAPKAEQKALI